MSEENYLLRKQDLRKFFSEFYGWVNKPLVSPLMIFIMGGVFIIQMVINSSLFTALALISLVITLITYFPVMLVKAKQRSGLLTLIGKILEIVIREDETDDLKVREIENAIKYLMEELNKYYEKKLQQFTEYLRKKRGVIQNEWRSN